MLSNQHSIILPHKCVQIIPAEVRVGAKCEELPSGRPRDVTAARMRRRDEEEVRNKEPLHSTNTAALTNF